MFEMEKDDPAAFAREANFIGYAARIADSPRP
jgi:hypothetical protein